MGLREIKKERLRSAILKAARTLFFSRGYDETTVEVIAEEAEVAVGTVYNYFDSKSSIILAITAEDTSVTLDGKFQIPASGTGFEIVKLYLKTFMDSLSMYPRKLLRELMKEAWGSIDKPLGSGLIKQDVTLIADLARLLTELSDNHKLRAGIDADHASMLIYGAVTTAIMWYAADDVRTSQQMLESLERMLELLFNGMDPEGRGK